MKCRLFWLIRMNSTVVLYSWTFKFCKVVRQQTWLKVADVTFFCSSVQNATAKELLNRSTFGKVITKDCVGVFWVTVYIVAIHHSAFLQGVSIACNAEPSISYDRVVRPSVRLSLTCWHCVKITQARITKSSPTDSPRTLVLAIKSSSRNWKGFTPSEGVK